MKTLLWALTFAWSALVGIVSVSGQEQLASEPVNFNNAKIINLVLQMKAQFELNGAKGFIVDPNNAGQTVQVMDGQSFTFFEGVLRNAITFAGLGVDGDKLLGAVPGFIQDTLNALFLNVQFSTVIPDLAAGAGIVQPGVGNVQALAENVEAVLASPEFVDPDLKIAFFAAQKQALNSFSAIVVESEDIARGPNMFCLVDKQCKGQRVDDKFGGLVLRKCNGILNGSPAEAGVAPSCDNFVAFFSLRWLLGWIILVYIIIVLWAIYMLYPRVKRLIAKRKQRAGGGREAKVEYNEQEQMVINTLAAQCASAENMLFQATDMLKQAKSMQTLLTVEARRENRLMMLTAEYFQALSAIAVTLTHQYLDHKTNTPGEKFNDDDPAVRALQLEVLNYVRDRLSLAFQADALTEKSLLRIAEAYAILKRVSDSLVLVGFSCDKEQEDGIGTLRTPIVDITENAFFLSGIFKATRSQIADNLDGTEVCVAIKNADTRNLKNVGPFPYLSDSARDGKNYDPRLQTVTNAPGKSLVYSMQNAGSQGETLQYFVRTFWGPEIAQIQQEASSWLKTDTSLESWIDRERKEREARAEPVVKRGAKKKRKKNKKNKHKHDKYQDVDETATEYTEYTEASGWSVMSNNTYVYNVESVVNQGLGIAGKPGLPFDVLGTTHKKSSKAFKFFETYFPNAAEWPKFYILIFVIIPIAIAIPMLVQIGQGAGSIDIDGNVAFKARAAGFGTSFLGVPAYYFLDGDVPNLVDLDSFVDLLSDAEDGARVARITDALGLTNGGLAQINDANGPFGQGLLFMSNDFVEGLFDQFDGASGRNPDLFTAEIQAGVLVQSKVAGLNTIRDQQRGQEVGTTLIYALMHNAGYFFGIVPLSLVRESLEILARRFPIVREIYPMSQWRDLHMNMGLAGIFYVTFGATVFLVMMLVSLGRSTPFSGLAGDPNFKNFFDLNANVLYLRQLLLPAVPLLLLMKYASRGPPVLMRKYAPTFLTKNYWETCYFLHYVVAFTAIIMLVLYRPQVFYWMGATWGFVWGGNKIVRILRTRKTTIKNTNLISYAVEDKRNNAKVRSDVLRITLNVPRSFPSSSRGQACWITVPEIDYIAHPFTLAKVPTTEDRTIMFHIGIKYLKGDDIISYARPETRSVKKEVAVPPPSNPDELPPGWKFASDPESGQVYYYNSAEGKTTWTKPRSNALDKMTEGARFLTSRFSANLLRGAGSTRFGQVKLDGAGGEGNTIREAAITNRATWTQRLAKLSQKIQSMDPDLRRNAIKDYPVYVSAPLGTSMDDCLLPSLPGSIIITTQNGLPAAESSVRWLLMQPKTHRPKFHFFVSVSREVNDALSVVETLRDAVCDSVVAGHLDIDGLNSRHAHMADWLGVYVHLTRRKPSQIEGDRDMLMKSLNPPAAPVTPQQLEVIESWVKNRVSPGRLAFDRFLQRSSQMVRKRTGLDKIAVGYCGSAKIAYAIRAAAREIPNMTFDGEYI